MFLIYLILTLLKIFSVTFQEFELEKFLINHIIAGHILLVR